MSSSDMGRLSNPRNARRHEVRACAMPPCRVPRRRSSHEEHQPVFFARISSAGAISRRPNRGEKAMSLRITSTSVVGATMILAFGAAAALAQAKPKSTKRIPITKEAAGEVVRDTVIRTDTLMVTNTVYRTDTLYRTVTRVDSVM